MTVILQYLWSQAWNRTTAPSTETVTETSLRYDYFLGDVVFRVGSADFSTDWGWIPLIDLAVSMSCAISELSTGSDRATVDFTESDDEITFVRTAVGRLHVSATYTDDIGIATVGAMERAVDGFVARLKEDLLRSYPDLGNNKAFSRLLSNV